MSERKNIERVRMEFAFENSKGAKDPKKYESYVLKVPAFLHTNGLGNTIAFIATQTNENWVKVGENIFDWLDNDKSIFAGKLTNAKSELENIFKESDTNIKRLKNELRLETNNEIKKLKKNAVHNAEKEHSKLIKPNKVNALLHYLINLNDDVAYRACTIEVFALFNWLRRFAKINKN